MNLLVIQDGIVWHRFSGFQYTSKWLKYRKNSSSSDDPLSAANLLKQLARSRSSLQILSNGASVKLTLPCLTSRVFKSKIDLINSPLYNPNLKVKTIDETKLSRFLKKYKGWDSVEISGEDLGALPEASPVEEKKVVEPAKKPTKSDKKGK
jgi:hypothetical protein